MALSAFDQQSLKTCIPRSQKTWNKNFLTIYEFTNISLVFGVSGGYFFRSRGSNFYKQNKPKS